MCNIMQSKQNLIDLREKIPYGGIKIIATDSKSSTIAVNKFFKGELKNQNKIRDIQTAILKLFKDLEQNNNSFFGNLKKVS